MRGSLRRGLLVAALGGATVLAAAAAAPAGSPGKEKVKLNAADQAAARATVVRLADLGSADGWKGGMVKPSLSPQPTCANYHPKQSDLVLTGAAESDFRSAGAEVNSEAQVLQTARMVTLDWKRSVLAPGAVPCLRQTFAKSLGSSGKLVSFRRISFPRIGRYSTGFLGVIDVTAQGQTVRVRIEIALVGRGRTEITLSVTDATQRPPSSLSALTVRLARAMAARAPA